MNNITEAPQDSVLRRHWLSSREVKTEPVQARDVQTIQKQPPQGYFSWLKSLFG